MAPKIAIYAGCAHQRVATEAMRDGMARHGIAAEIHGRMDLVDCDLAVFWGHRRHDIINRQRSAGRRYMVMERGYLGDRHRWTSLAYDGLNGNGQFYTPWPCSDERFIQHHGGSLVPWQDRSDGYALILGQVPGDASLQGRNLSGWYRIVGKMIEQQHSCPVIFRPHPEAIAKGLITPTGYPEHRGSLAEALAGARFAVTFNSNAAVDAVLAGVPTVTFDHGSMAYSVTGHQVDQIHHPDRIGWASWLAWCQWSLEEIETGTAWDQLKRGIE